MIKRAPRLTPEQTLGRSVCVVVVLALELAVGIDQMWTPGSQGGFG